jgi:hypothetical protein
MRIATLLVWLGQVSFNIVLFETIFCPFLEICWQIFLARPVSTPESDD